MITQRYISTALNSSGNELNQFLKQCKLLISTSSPNHMCLIYKEALKKQKKRSHQTKESCKCLKPTFCHTILPGTEKRKTGRQAFQASVKKNHLMPHQTTFCKRLKPTFRHTTNQGTGKKGRQAFQASVKKQT